MAEALAKVKAELGPDAVILNTRSLTRPRISSFQKKTRVEITAAPNNSDVVVPRPVANSRIDETYDRVGRASAVGRDPVATPRNARRPDPGSTNDSPEFTGRMPNWPSSLQASFERLVRQDVATELAAEIVRRVQSALTSTELDDSSAINSALRRVLVSMLPGADPICMRYGNRPRRIALVGPAGVGKTTTIAKLACRYAARVNGGIAVVSTDTHRIEAAAPLRLLGDLMDVPLREAGDGETLRRALSDLSDRKLVLIDSAGTSPTCAGEVRELGEMLAHADVDEIHLVLPTTMSHSAAGAAIQAFREIGADRVIFTKLDEAVGFGVMLTSLRIAGTRLSYLSRGRTFPEGLEVGSESVVASLLMNEWTLAGEATAPHRNSVYERSPASRIQ